jgi:uncharacterized protein
VTTVLVVIVSVYALVCIGAYLMQRQLIYFPQKHVSATPTAIGLKYDELSFTSPDGVKFIVWFVPAESSKISVVYFHGNAENLSHPLSTYKLLHELGASVYAFEYRGYANCSGSPSVQGIASDLTTFGDYLAKTVPDGTKVVVLGRSLGGALAVKLLSRTRVDGAILESTFNRMSDVAQTAFPYLPIALLLREQYNSEAEIKSFAKPVLVIHSPDDEVIPYALGKRLYESIQGEKSFVEIRGSHNGGVEESQEILRQAYADFFRLIIEKNK